MVVLSAADEIRARLEAHEMGRAAGRDGVTAADNPHPPGSGAARSWERGRAEGAKDLRRNR